MSYENFDPNDLLIQSFPTQPSGFVHRIPNGIRAIHLPTGTVVTCDTDRSQHRNRHLALTHLWDMVQGKPSYQELAAQVEALRGIAYLADGARVESSEGNFGEEKKWLDKLYQAAGEYDCTKTPQQHLRDVRAEAAIKGWWACWEWVDSDDRDKPTLITAADQYAASVRADEK